MSIFKAYRQERALHSAPESVATLDYMEEYFLDGKNWVQGVYQGAGNTRCMAAAAEHLRTSSIDDAKHWLRQAIVEHAGGAVATIEEFNDRQDSFEGVKAVLNRARQLAASNLPMPVASPLAVIEPVRSGVSNPHPNRDAFSPIATEPHPNPWAGHGVVIDAEPLPPEEKHERNSSLWEKMTDWID